MEQYRVIAESVIRPGRKLLMNQRGDGFLQLESEARPMPLSAADFDRLRRMGHYRPARSRRRVRARGDAVSATTAAR
ncbi:MAG: hypothetical protein QJR03_00330 [Sphaerobacter sp.]|nr:hypothetical protein [Sphaerobacter sp.]